MGEKSTGREKPETRIEGDSGRMKKNRGGGKESKNMDKLGVFSFHGGTSEWSPGRNRRRLLVFFDHRNQRRGRNTTQKQGKKVSAKKEEKSKKLRGQIRFKRKQERGITQKEKGEESFDRDASIWEKENRGGRLGGKKGT